MNREWVNCICWASFPLSLSCSNVFTMFINNEDILQQLYFWVYDLYCHLLLALIRLSNFGNSTDHIIDTSLIWLTRHVRGDVFTRTNPKYLAAVRQGNKLVRWSLLVLRVNVTNFGYSLFEQLYLNWFKVSLNIKHHGLDADVSST